MRLANVEHGDSFKHRMIFRLIRLLSGQRAPDVVRTLMYRPGFFGAQINPLFQETMRGPSEWSIGEREVFAAFTSKLNECEF